MSGFLITIRRGRLFHNRAKLGQDVYTPNLVGFGFNFDFWLTEREGGRGCAGHA